MMNYEYFDQHLIERIKDYKLNSNLVGTDVRVQLSVYNSKHF